MVRLSLLTKPSRFSLESREETLLCFGYFHQLSGGIPA
jgi:hypothetical protein